VKSVVSLSSVSAFFLINSPDVAYFCWTLTSCCLVLRYRPFRVTCYHIIEDNVFRHDITFNINVACFFETSLSTSKETRSCVALSVTLFPAPLLFILGGGGHKVQVKENISIAVTFAEFCLDQ
jgi:hypothetical protein